MKTPWEASLLCLSMVSWEEGLPLWPGAGWGETQAQLLRSHPRSKPLCVALFLATRDTVQTGIEMLEMSEWILCAEHMKYYSGCYVARALVESGRIRARALDWRPAAGPAAEEWGAVVGWACCRGSPSASGSAAWTGVGVWHSARTPSQVTPY
jgi:hypothetical protein